MIKKLINVCILGCGAITQHRHAPEYWDNQNCKLVGFYDSVESRAQELAGKYDANWYKSSEDIFADPNIDAVSICTPNETHASLTIAALEAGKHVLCEKPMALNIEDALKMVACSEKAGKNLMIGYNQRFLPAHIKAKEIISSGALGKVISFRTSFKHSGPDFWSVDKGKNIWFFDKKTSCFGVMGDLGVHKIDLIQYLLNVKIKAVCSNNITLNKRNSAGNPIEVADNSFCTFSTDGNIVGTMEVSWTNYGVEDNSTIIYCENGILRIYDDQDYALIIDSRDKTKTLFEIGNIATNDRQVKSGVIDEFICSILENRQPTVNGTDGINSLEVLNACFLSSSKGGISQKTTVN